MRLSDRIPVEGLLLAEGKDTLVFVPYTYREGKILVDGEDRTGLLNADVCHLFDRDTEYRRGRRRARKDTVETVLTAAEETAMDRNLVYQEEVMIKPRYTGRPGMPETLIIVNRYRYSEYDTLVLEDYRIAMK